MSSRNLDAESIDATILEECRTLATDWAPVLRALAHPERLLIVLWLANTSSTVRQLEQVTGLRQSLVSYHLRALSDAGLVRATPQGRANHYRLASDELDQLAALLGALQAGKSAPSSAPVPR